tara:strand:- start:6753 stop:9083 length:2331 start_codon:yes stop_codon:yes gene_type:complete
MGQPITPENKGENLARLRIADYYTSLLHVSGADIEALPKNDVYTGNGRITGLSLSAVNDRVVINRYIEPVGFDTVTEWLDAFFPINSIMLTATNNNPTNRIAGTKWAPEAGGKFLAGVGEGTDTNDPSYTFNFSPGYGGVRSGDIAGEYCVKLKASELAAHTHDVNSGFVTVGSFDTSKQFIFYFGSTVNPQGLTEEKVFSGNNQLLPNVANNPFPYFLEQDRIEAFQNNTTYDGQAEYRTHLIRQRHVNGYRYTDSDFNPSLGNYSLAGWGGSVVGGPGWGGLLTVNNTNFGSTKVFVNNGPRPVGVPFTGQDNTGGVLEASDYDPRDNDRVHPGQLGSQDLLRARNIIVDVLGQDEAAIALEGVNRLKELDEQVNNTTYIGRTTAEQRPAEGVNRTTTNTGASKCHNNILPNYGIYVWRRVPLDFVIPVPPQDEVVDDGPVVQPPVDETMWRGTITRNRKHLNLNSWARDRGWNGISPATITVKNNVYIWSDKITKPAMTIGNWPNGLTLINKGFIMGRGGDGGSYGATRQKGGPKPPGGGWFTGWNGGDAIKITSTSQIFIKNNKGAIAGGGGGGAGGGTGNFGGGGGGAGGGKGGIGAKEREGIYEKSGPGGSIGNSGGDGGAFLNRSGRTGRMGNTSNLKGRGGQAGGGGSGGWKASSNDPHGGGGGGGRKLSKSGASSGGRGGESGGGQGGSKNNNGKSVSSRKKGRKGWGNASGGGGWGANGGNQNTNARVSAGGGPRKPKGGKGGKAVNSRGGSNYRISGGIVYGKKD